MQNIISGSSETKLLIASFLGQLVLIKDTKVLVCKAVGSALINLMVNGTTQEKDAAIKALGQISSYEVSDKLLIKAGILQPLINNILPPTNTVTEKEDKELPFVLKEISANILANVMCHCDDADQMSFVSEDVISGLLHLTSNTGRSMQSKLLEILIGLTNSLNSCQKVSEAIKNSGACDSLVQYIDAPWKEIQSAALKVLRNICPYIQCEIMLALTNGIGGGYLGKLFDIVAETSSLSDEQVAAVSILAEVLPENNSRLFRRLLNENRFIPVTSQTKTMMKREVYGGSSRYINPFLEGLAVVLLKLVLNLDCSISFIRENNLVAIFADLLNTSANGSDKVLIVSAHAIEHLSRKTCQLVRTNKEAPGCMVTEWYRNRNRRRPMVSDYCSVHCGYCLMEDDFCIVQGCVVGKLILCLDHPNKEVVSAALEAICTLLEDDTAGTKHVNIKQAIYVLITIDGIDPIMQILLNNSNFNHYDRLQKKAVWAVERILRIDDVCQHFFNDKNIIEALKHTYQHSVDDQTKHLSESALNHLDKMPVFSGIFTKSAY